MSYKFTTAKGKPTDILHSQQFLSKSLNDRREVAFNKEKRKNMSRDDQLRMEGYAACLDHSFKATLAKKYGGYGNIPNKKPSGNQNNKNLPKF